ncbi:MAG: hypothetical protein K2L89_05135 [Muribaculaceae bacterium]|nr:hypothetical protein [Muribaculaceae bacterium]
MRLNDICQKVEVTAGFVPSSPKQFEELAELIFHHTGRLLSPTTLKRIWGYIDEPLSTRRSTLDTLAKFCGWKDYEDFEKGNIPEAESGPVGKNCINAESDMKRGDRIRLMWPPSRVCVIEYCGNGSWKVIEAIGTRLLPGDTFTAPLIVAGEPLYLSNLIHAGEKAGIYVCGRRSGIHFLKEISV